MKVFLIAALALSVNGAFAATPATVGSVEFVAYSDGGPTSFDSQFEIDDNGSSLVGTSTSDVSLSKQPNGYKGLVLGRFLDIACTQSHCTDNGSAQIDLTITPVSGGYTLSGTMNFVFVQATVTASEISLSADGGNVDVGFDLTSDGVGHYSGDGTDGYNTFTAMLSTTGSLTGLTDPAAFVALMVNPFVGQ